MVKIFIRNNNQWNENSIVEHFNLKYDMVHSISEKMFFKILKFKSEKTTVTYDPKYKTYRIQRPYNH